MIGKIIVETLNSGMMASENLKVRYRTVIERSAGWADKLPVGIAEISWIILNGMMLVTALPRLPRKLMH